MQRNVCELMFVSHDGYDSATLLQRYRLMTCWLSFDDMLGIVWWHVGYRLMTCWLSFDDMLAIVWWHVGFRLMTCWLSFDDMLVIVWWHVGYRLMTCWARLLLALHAFHQSWHFYLIWNHFSAFWALLQIKTTILYIGTPSIKIRRETTQCQRAVIYFIQNPSAPVQAYIGRHWRCNEIHILVGRHTGVCKIRQFSGKETIIIVFVFRKHNTGVHPLIYAKSFVVICFYIGYVVVRLHCLI